jgi:sulfur-carrier protein
MTGAFVRLRGPLKQLAGGGEHAVDGATVRQILQRLESEQPPLDGWILDERDRIRRHINVFVNGERGNEDTPVAEGDRIDVLPAISGGSA